MLEIRFIPPEEIERVKKADIEELEKLKILSDVCRLNTLSAVKKAGSGHLGSSLSAMDIVTYLYLYEMNVVEKGVDSPDRDIYFSSKGHDCPGHYSVLVAAGILPYEMLLKLRRLGGLDGHPDVSIRGIEANSGSLGMGISKAKGMALAKKMKGWGGRVFVMTGDGELQEGQIWESLQTTAHQGINNVTVIVDFNKIQSDKPVSEIIDLGDLVEKFRVFGWHAERCDGHDYRALKETFERLKRVDDKPKAIIADTIKGKGVSFMEGPRALKEGGGLYRWHAGAPDDDSYERGYEEVLERINSALGELGLEPVRTELVETREKGRVRLKDVAEKVVVAFSEALVDVGRRREDVVVLDADLSADCGLRPFENTFPERFIENGIAEQDMVSMAGGLALQGYLPIVNSFGVFLASRSNEQVYTNATENTKIIYVCHYAGLIPAGPGKSHQSLRDISLFGALPRFAIIEPCNGVETKWALDWCVDESEDSCMMRLVISPSPRTIELPEDYRFTQGRGAVLRDGSDGVILGYGPVMLNEALKAAEVLEDEGFGLKVINMPWLNRVDIQWLEDVLEGFDEVFVVDNHFTYGGLGDTILNAINESDRLRGKRVHKLGLTEHPQWGTPPEVLKYHGLDGESMAERIKCTHERLST